MSNSECSGVVLFLLGFIILCALYIPIMLRRDKKKMRRLFDDIKIGDKYIRRYEADSPFEEPVVFNLTIIDKAISESGTMWVKIQYGDGSIAAERFYLFIEDSTKAED